MTHRIPQSNAMQLLESWQHSATPVSAWFARSGGVSSCMLIGQLKLGTAARVIITGAAAGLAVSLRQAEFEFGTVLMFPVPIPPGQEVPGLSIMTSTADWLFLSPSALPGLQKIGFPAVR